MISPCPVAKLNWMVTHLLKKNKETVYKIFLVTLICTNMVEHTLYNISLFLRIPSNSELQNSLLKFDLTTYSAIYTIAEMC